MNKDDLKKLALLGITGGVMVASPVAAAANNQSMPNQKVQDSGQLSEADFMSKLNSEGKTLYLNMTPEGKKLARELAAQKCAGHNKCAGLNSCASKENACAGKGSCAGHGKCAFKDANKAVKVAQQHMQNKRNQMNQSMQQNQYRQLQRRSNVR